MKLSILLIASIFSVALIGMAQPAIAQEIACTIKPTKSPMRGKSLIPEFLTFKFDPKIAGKVLVTDAVSLQFNGAASEGAILLRDEKTLKISWIVDLMFLDGVRERVQYIMRMRNKDGKSTVTARGPNLGGSVFGRGKCILR